MDCIAGADASMSFPSIVILAFSEPWRVNSAELVNNVPVNPVALVKVVVASAIIVVAELIVNVSEITKSPATWIVSLALVMADCKSAKEVIELFTASHFAYKVSVPLVVLSVFGVTIPLSSTGVLNAAS